MKRERKTNRVGGYLSDCIKEAFEYTKDSKNYIYLIIGIFIVSILIGFFNASYLGFIDKFLKDLVERTAGLYGIDLISFILVNNAGSALLGLFFGIFLGIFSVINTI